LLDAVERKQVLPFEVDTVRRQRLLDAKKGEVGRRAARLFASAVNANRQKVIEAYRPALTLNGDATRGLAVFNRTCSSCHQINGVGHAVGPNLGSVADKSGDALLTAILDPNQAIEARYVNYTATTSNGLVFNGVIASESGNSVTLVAADGKTQVILRSNLDDLVSTGKSLMPEGLENDLRQQDVADLIAFLRANTYMARRKTFEGNEPALVRPDADGTLRLPASNCAIYGRTLTFEKQHGNLGVWHGEDDQAVWTVQVPRAGKYAVWLDWSCAADTAGNAFALTAGKERLSAKVQSTGTWDDYRQARVGEIALAVGEQQVVFRSAGRIQGALIDLKGMKLVPVP